MGPRQIGRYGFILCTLALLWLAFVVRNDWSAVPVLFGLVLFGIGQGSLVTLLFNVLVTASPKELAGDVGSPAAPRRTSPQPSGRLSRVRFSLAY
jgi:riboflavin transporter FmnP